MRKVNQSPKPDFIPAAHHSFVSQPTVAHLEKLSPLTEISEIELWVLEGSDKTLINRLKAKATEILRKSKPPMPKCECNDAIPVGRGPCVKQEPGTNLKQELDVKVEHEEIDPPICRCEAPKRVFRLKHLVRRHGQWGTPFWGSERVEEIEVSPLEE